MPGCARALCAARRALRLNATAMRAFDPRLTPARADLAAKELEGKVTAARYVEGRALRGDRAAGAAARASRAPDAPLATEALKGERVTIYDSERRRLGLGPARGRRLCRLAAGECAGAGRRAADAQGRRRCGPSSFPGPSIKLPPIEALPLGARLAVVRFEDRMAVTRSGAYVPATHLAPIGIVRAGFRRRGGALSRRALSVGRQDRARARLLGAGSGRARGLRRCLPARQRHAGSGARRAGRAPAILPNCGAAT